MSVLTIVAIAIPATLVLCVIIAYLIWYNSTEQKNLRTIRATPGVRIADAAEGQLVRVVGELKLRGKGLVSPVTETACAYYETRILESRRGESSAASSNWITVWRDTDSRDFYVQDDSGLALVHTLHAKAIVSDRIEYSIGTLNDDNPELRLFAQAHGLLSQGLLGGDQPLRSEEGLLEPGKKVAVVGIARWVDGARNESSDGHSSDPQRLLHIEAPHGDSVLLSDNLLAWTS